MSAEEDAIRADAKAKIEAGAAPFGACVYCCLDPLKDGGAVFRLNKLGETGIWACAKHHHLGLPR